MGVVGDGEDDEYNDEPDDDDAEKLPRHQNFHVAESIIGPTTLTPKSFRHPFSLSGRRP